VIAIAKTPSLNASTRDVDQRSWGSGSPICGTVADRRVTRDHPKRVMPVHPHRRTMKVGPNKEMPDGEHAVRPEIL
jgi:hypothetical protein